MFKRNLRNVKDYFSRKIADNRGSFLVAGIFFSMIFLMIAGLAIDASRYMMKTQKWQQIADNAARTGAQALNQYTDDPDLSLAYDAALDYIEDKLGSEYRDLYEVSSPTEVEGIEVYNWGEENIGPCPVDFEINGNSIVTGGPAQATSKVLGAAITYGAGGERVPVTASATVTEATGDETRLEPWGDPEDYQNSDLNTGEEIPASDMGEYDSGTVFDYEATSWINGNKYITAGTNSGNTSNVITLRDGESVPDFEPFAGQEEITDVLGDYIDPNTGDVTLQSNQAIMLFELGTTNQGSSSFDMQDLVLLVDMKPQAGAGADYNPRRSPFREALPPIQQEYGCGSFADEVYRVGVIVYGSFEPYFMPRTIFGGTAFARTAVAELRSSALGVVEKQPIDCGLFAGGDITLTGNNFNHHIDGSPASLCANGNIDAGGSNNGIIGDIYTAGNAVPPGGQHGDIHTNQPPYPMPDFVFTDSNNPDYDVLLNDTNIATWDDCGAGAYLFDSGKSNIMMAWQSFLRPSPAYAVPPGGGPPGGGTSKELTTTDGQHVGVCVEKTASGQYSFASGTDMSSSSLQTGNSIGIYVDGSVSFSQNSKVHGGVYATEDISVTGNNNEFIGDKDKLGGLSLWAEGNVSVAMNNVEIVGITGASGSYQFTGPPWGGGGMSGFRGILITGGSFFSGDNSAHTRFQFDPTVFDYEALNMSGWVEGIQAEMNRPKLAHTRIRLIH